jgi:O-antigen/teichoic acid export membrane protein
VGVGRLVRLAWRGVAREVVPLDRAAVREVLGAYRKLPLYDLPSSIIDTLAVSLVVPLLSQTYGTQSAGYVSLVLSVLTLPVALVGRSVADVFHARMALYGRTDPTRIVSFFLATSGTLLLVGIAPAVVLMVFGPLVFPWVFGEAWTTAGHLAAEMAPWALAGLIVAPVSRVVVIFQAQELKLIYDLLALAGVAGSLLLGGALRLELLESVKWLTVAQVVAYVVYFGLLLHVVRRTRGRGAPIGSRA